MDRDDWRHANACIRCHSLKLKCRRRLYELTCGRCEKHRMVCTPRPPKRQRQQDCTPSTSSSEVLTPVNVAACTPTTFGNYAPLPLSPMTLVSSSDLNMSPHSQVPDSNAQFYTPDWVDPSSTVGNLFDPGNLAMSSFADMAVNTASRSSTESRRSYEVMDGSEIAQDPRTHDFSSVLMELGETNMGYDMTGANTPDFLLEELFQLGAKLFAHKVRHTARAPLPSNGSCGTFTTTLDSSSRTSEQHLFDNSLDLARKFSNLIERLFTATKEEESPSSVYEDQPKNLLFSSIYVKLLDIFSSQLAQIEDSLRQKRSALGVDENSCPLPGVVSGTHDLTDQPMTQAFIAVNMMELYIHRIGRALGLTAAHGPFAVQTRESHPHYNEGIRGSSRTFACVRDHLALDDSEDRASEIPRVVYERQSKLLRTTARLRGTLIAAQER